MSDNELFSGAEDDGDDELIIDADELARSSTNADHFAFDDDDEVLIPPPPPTQNDGFAVPAAVIRPKRSSTDNHLVPFEVTDPPFSPIYIFKSFFYRQSLVEMLMRYALNML